MLSCKDVSHLNSARFDRFLTLRERCLVWLHLKICPACRRVFAQLRFMRHAMQRYRDELRSRDEKS